MEVTLEYDPREHQLEVHNNLKRWNVLVCHRRFGKTVLCINQLIVDCLRCQNSNPRFAYIAPLYKQAKAIAWDYLKEFTRPIPNMKYNEAELRADFPNGGRITLYGADNPDSLRGIYLDGIVLDEYAQMSPRAWSEVIRPALSDRKGYAIFIGTPMGHNAFYDLYMHAKQNEDWYAAIFKASDTGVVDEEELLDARATMTPDEYAQEYECSFEAAVKGAYYAEQVKQMKDQQRVCKVPYDPNLPVFTAWDLGISDSTCILFYQLYSKEIRIIETVEEHGEGITFYSELLKGKNYKYGAHYLPHDADARQLGTGKTIREQLHEQGIDNVHIVPRQSIMDGIQAVRLIFPRIWIHESNADFIEAVTQYRKEYDEKKQVFKDRPLHDWTSHYADALRMLALSIPKDTFRKPKPKPKPQGYQKKLQIF